MRAKLRDYRDWIQERAAKIAEKEFHEDFDDLSSIIQNDIYKQATTDYTTAYCALIYPKRNNYPSRRQYALAQRQWRVWNKTQLKDRK